LSVVVNPYGNGIASQIILKTLQNIDLKNILKKTFYDLDMVNNEFNH
jgi:GDP/UDP-N,N'-diacetylbacillosamine 2-epimerase (hydrolysing)